jgi:Ca-activated chloride channel family protein
MIMISCFILLLPLITYSQGDKKFIRQGNREYGKEKYSDSEIEYRKALDKNNTSADAVFNTGDALYRQKKFDEAGKQFSQNYDMTDGSMKKSASLYNLGNSLLMANKVAESIDAYKASLKLDPDNMEAKYNLGYAQDLLKQQQQQQQNQDQNKENQDNKDQKQQDQKGDQEQKQNQDKEQQQKQEQAVSKEDAERILNALANEEKDIQEKIKLAKARKEQVRTVRNW